jgi:hypothetical protein
MIPLKERFYKCDRCKHEYESTYLLPHGYQNYPEKQICRECSKIFYEQFDKFISNFLNQEKSESKRKNEKEIEKNERSE